MYIFPVRMKNPCNGCKSFSCLCSVHQESKKETTTFTLNAVETERLRRFVSEHKKHARHLVFGELVKVSFVPSTMGASGDGFRWVSTQMY